MYTHAEILRLLEDIETDVRSERCSLTMGLTHAFLLGEEWAKQRSSATETPPETPHAKKSS